MEKNIELNEVSNIVEAKVLNWYVFRGSNVQDFVVG